MSQNIPLALVVGVLASFGFALGAMWQHTGVGRVLTSDTDRHLGVQRVWHMLRTPIWLFGTVLIVASAGLHLVGVMVAPVTVIQPIGILAVPFAAMLAAHKNRRLPTSRMWLAIALAVFGIVSFTVISSLTAATDTIVNGRAIFFAALAIWAGAGVFVVVGAKGPVGFRCLAWATAGGFMYGLATALIKTTVELVQQDRETPLSLSLSVGGLLLCYLVGAWFIQQGYATGPPEIVVGSLTAVDPLIAVTFGIAVLGEGRNIGPLAALGMILLGGLSAWGVALLSKYHPDAATAFEPAQPKEGIPR